MLISLNNLQERNIKFSTMAYLLSLSIILIYLNPK